MRLAEILEVFGFALIILDIGPILAFILAVYCLARRPDVVGLRIWTAILGFIALFGTGTALIAINYELGEFFRDSIYPMGFGIVILAAVMVTGAIGSWVFIGNYFRPLGKIR